MSRRVVIIDNDIDDLEMLETAILEVSPAATCLSFVFADEAIRVKGRAKLGSLIIYLLTST